MDMLRFVLQHNCMHMAIAQIGEAAGIPDLSFAEDYLSWLKLNFHRLPAGNDIAFHREMVTERLAWYGETDRDSMKVSKLAALSLFLRQVRDINFSLRADRFAQYWMEFLRFLEYFLLIHESHYFRIKLLQFGSINFRWYPAIIGPPGSSDALQLCHQSCDYWLSEWLKTPLPDRGHWTRSDSTRHYFDGSPRMARVLIAHTVARLLKEDALERSWSSKIVVQR